MQAAFSPARSVATPLADFRNRTNSRGRTRRLIAQSSARRNGDQSPGVDPPPIPPTPVHFFSGSGGGGASPRHQSAFRLKAESALTFDIRPSGITYRPGASEML